MGIKKKGKEAELGKGHVGAAHALNAPFVGFLANNQNTDHDV